MKKRMLLLVPMMIGVLTACGEDADDSGRGSVKDQAEVTQKDTETIEEAKDTATEETEKSAAEETEAVQETPEPTEVSESNENRFADRPNANERTGVVKELSEGDVAPDFYVTTKDGGTFQLSDHDDEVVILNFWATWCPPCVGEMPAFEKLNADGNAVVIGVDCAERKADVDAFIEKNGYTYTIGYDEDYTVGSYYPTDGIPYTLVIDHGIIHAIFVGAQGADVMYKEYSAAIAECLE